MIRTELKLILFAMMLIVGTGYQLSSERKCCSAAARLALKGTATALAGLFALYVYLIFGQTYMLLMVIGLFLCAAADVLLEIRFLWGTACFAAGHLF